MLLNPEAEGRIDEIIEAMSDAFAEYAIGRNLKGRTSVPNAKVNSLGSISGLSFLDVAYLTGKMADLIGPKAVAQLQLQEVYQWILSNKVSIEKSDQAMVAQLHDQTARWLLNQQGEWKRKVRTQINLADHEWAGFLSDHEGDVGETRSIAIQQLALSIEEITEALDGDMYRLIQTEAFHYFQQGHLINTPGDELVYKVPRLAACEHCMKLHVKEDGSPQTFFLKDVRQQSNWTKPPYSWRFTVGPTHPHCYCPLYRASQDPVPDVNQDLARARQEVLSKPLRKAARAKSLRKPTEDKYYFQNFLGLLRESFQFEE